MSDTLTKPTFYKAFAPDGFDFNSHTIDYGKAFAAGETVKHPRPGKEVTGYLSVTDDPTELPGARWPLVLWEVEPVGKSWKASDYKHKHACHEVRGVRQVESHLALGPGGEHVLRAIETWQALPYEERNRLYSMPRSDAWYTARGKAWDAAVSLGVGSDPASFDLGLGDDDWAAGLGGALAALVRHGIDREDIAFTKRDYATLTAPFRKHVGAVHPDDKLPAKAAS